MSEIISKLEALRAKATPGRWAADRQYVTGDVPSGRPGGEVIVCCRPTVRRLLDVVPNEDNAAHIAALHNAEEALLAVARAAEAKAASTCNCPQFYGNYPDHWCALCQALAALGEEVAA